MPANSLRHELREAMLEPIFDELRGKHSLTIGAYAAAKSGNASGSPDGVAASFDERMAISQHPFLGVFAGGPRMIEGKLKVDAAYPILADTLGLLGDGYEGLAASGKITNVEFKRRVDPIVSIAPEDAPLITDAESAITAWSNDAAGPEAGDEEDGGSRGLRAFNAHEVVIPGVHWLWRISLRNPTEAQRGLLLLAIEALNGRHFGGSSSLAYGQIQIKSVSVDGNEVWDGGGLIDDDIVTTACGAWAEAIDTISPTDFEAFASSAKV